MTTTFDPQQYKTTTRAQWEDAAEAWHRWGPTIEDWLGAATERMLDAAGDHRRQPGARRRRRRRRAEPRRGPPGRPDRARAGHRHLPGHPRVRGEGRRRRRADQRRHPGAGRRAPRRRRGRLRRGHLPGRADLLPGPAGRAGRHARRAASRRAHLRRRLLHRRPQRLLRRPGRHHPPPRPAAAARARAARPVQPRRAPASPRRPSPRPGSATSPSRRCRRRCGWPAPPSASRFERESFGALHQMLAGLPEAEREAAWAEIGEALAQFEGPDGFAGPCEMLVVSGHPLRGSAMTTVKVAAVQAAYVLMDQKACLDKAVDLLHEAAAGGAGIVVFPEVFIPGTPIWIDTAADLGRRRRLVRDAGRPGRCGARPGHRHPRRRRPRHRHLPGDRGGRTRAARHHHLQHHRSTSDPTAPCSASTAS